MHTRGLDPSAELWAHLLAQSPEPVLRVPDLRSALRWWREATAARIVLRGRLGDLRIAVLEFEEAAESLVVMVGGPGALEAPSSHADLPVDPGAGADGRALSDPWGNTLVVPAAYASTDAAA